VLALLQELLEDPVAAALAAELEPAEQGAVAVLGDPASMVVWLAVAVRVPERKHAASAGVQLGVEVGS